MAFFACNPTDTQKEQIAKRQAAVSSIESGLLNGINSQWTKDMSNDDLKNTSDAGDYVVFSGWTKLVLDELYASSLQTGKLEALATAVNSDKGQELLKDFNTNAENIIPLLRQVGFVSSDISELVYSLIYSFIENSSTVLKGMSEKLLAVKTAKNADSVDKNIAAVNYEIAYLTFSDKEREDTLGALSAAREPIKILASFAYTTSINTLTDNMVEVISSDDGALSDITDGEIQSVVNAMMTNIRDLKANMTAEKIQKLNAVIKILTNKFNSNVTTSSVLAQIVNYAEYVYILTDSIPYLCSVATAASGVVDTAFLETIRDFVEDKELFSEQIEIANLEVISARLTKQVFDNIDKAELNGLVETLERQATTEYSRALPLIVADLYVNLMAYNDETDELIHDTLTMEDLENETIYLLGFFTVSGFESAYYKYIDGDPTVDIAALRRAANFDFLDIENPYSASEKTKEWFEYYMTEAKKKLGEIATELAPKLKNDLLLFVDDYYSVSLSVKGDVKTLAEKPLIAPLADDATDDEIAQSEQKVEEYKNLAISSRVYGLAYLIKWIFVN